MSKVIVGMSGGVDSAVTAYLLKQAGYDVVGVTLRTWEGEEGQESRCCEIDDAKEAARRIGIPHHTFNCKAEFEEKVTKPFIQEYLRGRTPNPCVICNRVLKWDRMLYYAELLKADYIATGHYAFVDRLPNGRYTVREAAHAEKDQTYMLYRLTQEQLARTLMPLGSYAKSEVRNIAEQIGLPIAAKPDSQEICFVTNESYTDYIIRNATGPVPGPGQFVDEAGKVVGEHKGIIYYTVGQRKGLGIALGHRVYVKAICAEQNRIVLGNAEDNACRRIVCDSLNYMGLKDLEDGEAVRCFVKVRYSHAGQQAILKASSDGTVKVSFDEPVRFAAPGQSAVFYDDQGCVLGGGLIRDVLFGEE